MKARLTVIVTAHDNAKDIPRCLDALLGQTFKDLSILCIDDASKDNSLTVFEEYAKQHPQIKVITNATNQGIATVRNQAIEACTTPYLMFCDADDYYTPTACADLYHAITTSNADLAIGEILVTYQAHHEMKPSDDNYYSLKYYGLQAIDRDLVFGLDLSPTNKIYRKSILDQYQIRCPAGKHFEDAYLNIAYLAVSHSIYFVNKPVYNYIRHTGSIMSKTWSKDSGEDFSIEHLDIAFALYDFFEAHNLFRSRQNHEIFWIAFHDFEALAINHSKSRANTKRAQADIRAFLQAHADSFKTLPSQLQGAIRYYSYGGLHLQITRAKRLLLHIMPSYKLAISNVNRLTALKNSNQQLLDRLQSLEDRLTQDTK